MMRKLNLPLALILGLAFYSWIYHSMDQIKKAEWLIGTWENKTPQGSIYETWEKVNDHSFSGKSYVLKEKDTTVFETISLIEDQDSLFYIPTVENQNNGLPVRFTAKSISEYKLVFENPQHDFPQIITYTRVHPDSLIAEISGINNGMERKLTFPMKRLQ